MAISFSNDESYYNEIYQGLLGVEKVKKMWPVVVMTERALCHYCSCASQNPYSVPSIAEILSVTPTSKNSIGFLSWINRKKVKSVGVLV